MIWAPPPPPVSTLSLFLTLPIYRRSRLLTGKGGGANHTTEEKAWSSINHSILSKHTWAHWWDLGATRPELDGAATPGSSSGRSHQTQYFAHQRPPCLAKWKMSPVFFQTFRRSLWYPKRYGTGTSVSEKANCSKTKMGKPQHTLSKTSFHSGK